ncbi:MAG TPA: hypothetical protein VEA63_05140, partial [Opitutus sp.]|nr:hypothetical protein [Opitutus sp.]
MSSFREIRGRLAVIAAAACAAANVSEAAKSTDDGIAGAKRDYETITAPKAGTGPSRLGFPKQSLPELDAAPPLPAGPSPTSPYRKNGITKNDAEEKPEKSENWLVDAMTKTDQGERDAATDLPNATAKAEAKGDLVALAAALEREEKATEKTREAREELKAAESTTVNPLGAYMTNWLSSRDLALLNPASISTSADGADKMLLAAPGSGGSEASVAAPTAVFDHLAAGNRDGGIDRMVSPTPNPYLAASDDLLIAPPTEFSMPTASAPSAPAPVSPPTTLPAPEAPSRPSPATL